jgi:hypothetical protein
MLLSGVLFVLFLAGFWIYCLTDAALTPAAEFRGLSKNTWIYVIAATFVVGAFAWLVARRSWRTKSWVTAQTGPGRVAGADFGWHSTWTAEDAAIARHPASQPRQTRPDGHGNVLMGPDDDEDFLRQLDHRIRGTSADPGELSRTYLAGDAASPQPGSVPPSPHQQRGQPGRLHAAPDGNVAKAKAHRLHAVGE